MIVLWCKVKKVWLPLGAAQNKAGKEALERWAWSCGYPTREGIRGPIAIGPDDALHEPDCWNTIESMENAEQVVIHIDRCMC